MSVTAGHEINYWGVCLCTPTWDCTRVQFWGTGVFTFYICLLHYVSGKNIATAIGSFS